MSKKTNKMIHSDPKKRIKLEKEMIGSFYQSILDNPKEWELLAFQLEQLNSYLTSEESRTLVKAKRKLKLKRRT